MLAFYFPSHVGFQFAPVDVKLLGTHVPLSPLLGQKLSTSPLYIILCDSVNLILCFHKESINKVKISNIFILNIHITFYFHTT